jgi:hypothetical protein
MGATTFVTYGFGQTAKEAFSEAVDTAKYLDGHGGYTGTIAEKSSVTLIPDEEHKRKNKQKFIGDLIDAGDERIDSKWGPAGAINISGTKDAKRYRERNGLKGKHGSVFIFFGWASC